MISSCINLRCAFEAIRKKATSERGYRLIVNRFLTCTKKLWTDFWYYMCSGHDRFILAEMKTYKNLTPENARTCAFLFSWLGINEKRILQSLATNVPEKNIFKPPLTYCYQLSVLDLLLSTLSVITTDKPSKTVVKTLRCPGRRPNVIARVEPSDNCNKVATFHTNECSTSQQVSTSQPLKCSPALKISTTSLQHVQWVIADLVLLLQKMAYFTMNFVFLTGCY